MTKVKQRYIKSENRKWLSLYLLLHEDHFTDVGSFYKNREDKPKTLLRDKETLKFIDEKIRETPDDNPKKEVLQQFRRFQKDYDQDAEKKVDWGVDYFDYRQISYKDAETINSNRDKIINNRSYIIGIGYAGKKILIPGDIWFKATQKLRRSYPRRGVSNLSL